MIKLIISSILLASFNTFRTNVRKIFPVLYKGIYMKSKEIRQKFLDFFKRHGHEVVASSSLIPAEDPTLLFANAGMNQFKDLFLGKEKRSYTRATTVQKCVRAGGKHNDLDNVGFTKRHLTFFEMMGNFSFGDYFKSDAITYAWEFLTKDLGLDASKLYISVYKDDNEAYDLWNKMIGVPTERIVRLGAQDNFWQMGDTGPCGPCTEIYVDRGIQHGCNDPHCGPGCNCGRFLEIWNLVFMQFDRQPDGADVPLKQTGVDTGAGIERVASIVQNKDSVYETDLFMPIINHTEKLTGMSYTSATGQTKAAFNVLADHIRSSSLLIADGCSPSNDGRGYVLRKIIRRAALFAQKLSTDPHLFVKLVPVVVNELGDVYPELKTGQKLITEVLTSEVDKFATNLVRGKQLLEKYMQQASDKVIAGQEVFKMYDTYGFPTELTNLIAQEHGFTVDIDGFNLLMDQQREQSGKKETHDFEYIQDLDPEIQTQFTGYHELETASVITALIKDGKSIPAVQAGDPVYIITQKSPFFIVGGGQVPDQGSITIKGHTVPIKSVRFIKKGIAAQITAPCTINVGDNIISQVDAQKRADAMKNHTATHLLQAALMQLFGKQIKQSGSLVHPEYLRFDFTYHAPLSDADIKQVEDIVNSKIQEDIKVDVNYMPYRESVKLGALAFFGDKYNPEEVRVVNVPGFSVELCGGTHVPSTGVIGAFKIIQETALAAGHRRIFAVTGPKAIHLFQEMFNTVTNMSQLFKVKHEQVLDAVEKLHHQHKELQKELKAAQNRLVLAQLPHLLAQAKVVNGIPYVFALFDDVQPDTLKEAITHATQKPGFYFFGSTLQDKVAFIAAVSGELAHRVNLKTFAPWLKEHAQLQGGGNATMVQGGGATFNKQLKDMIEQWISKQ